MRSQPAQLKEDVRRETGMSRFWQATSDRSWRTDALDRQLSVRARESAAAGRVDPALGCRSR